MMLPLSLIVDKTRNTSKVISLFGILGGSFTIIGMYDVQLNNISLIKYIFVGESPDHLYFMNHYLMIVVSLVVLLNSKKFTK